MKLKLIALLKPKFANKGFSQKTIEGLAEILIKNLTDESTEDEINAAIDGVTPFAEIMQAENTRYANEVKSKLPKVETPKADPLNPDPENETPAWAKAMIAKIEKLESEKTQATTKQKFAELMGKEIPATRYSRIALPETDEELNALADEIKAEHAAELQGSVNGGLGGDRPAGAAAAAAAAAAAEKVSPVVKQFIEKAQAERKTA